MNAANTYVGLGANVIISSQTPNNPCESGTCSYTAGRFAGYASDAATESGTTYADHGQTTADAFIAAGVDVVTTYYPNDHTHTSPEGADVVAQAFITALQATDSTLNDYIL